MPMIDFKAVKATLPLSRVLALIGYHTGPFMRTRFKGRCPLGCCGDARCANFDLVKNVWFCHKCRKGGDQLALYRLFRRWEFFPAVRDLCERCGVPFPALTALPSPCLREPKQPEDA